MNKTLIGSLFIFVGLIYGSFAFDSLSARTLGWLIKNQWIKPPAENRIKKATPFGARSTVILYSLFLIIIGIFILWNRNA